MINLIIGVLIGVGIMCFLQINRLTKMQNRINKAIKYIKDKQKIQYKYALSHIECDDLLDILGGDVDDE